MKSRFLATIASICLCISVLPNAGIAASTADPEGFKEKGRFAPPNQPKKKQVGQFPEGAFAYPVIANGRLYIRDLGTLWAYDIKAGS